MRMNSNKLWVQFKHIHELRPLKSIFGNDGVGVRVSNSWILKAAEVDGIPETLSGVAYVNLTICQWLKDDHLKWLRGVHTIWMGLCNITDAALVHLQGIHTLKLASCYDVTDKGMANPRDVHTLDISHCRKITDRVTIFRRSLRLRHQWLCKSNRCWSSLSERNSEIVNESLSGYGCWIGLFERCARSQHE